MTDPWNSSQNCYSYAFGHYEERPYWQQQPGLHSGLYQKGQKTRFTCPLMLQRTLADNQHDTYVADCHGTCPEGHHKIALAVDPGDPGDYHFFREDPDGSWSHKVGRGQVYKMTVPPWDSPRYFGRRHYSDFCACMCTKTDGLLGPLTP